MKQISAVEWLIGQLTSINQLEIPEGSNIVTSILEQANQIFKDQIIDAYQTSHISMMTAEQYYNEKYTE